MQRRSVLKWIAAVPFAGGLAHAGITVPTTWAWQTLAAMQEHLLPGGGERPSAASVNATAYLYMTMNHKSFDFEVRDFILLGTQWVDQEARSLYGLPFYRLEHDACEHICKILLNEYGRGEAWLSTVISYTLEALLGDPVYGCNTGGKGWKWLEHIPGEPRPSKRFVHGV